MPNLTIIQDLPEVILLNEGARIQIEADSPFTAGTVAELSLAFAESDLSHLDEYFTLDFNGISQTFIFKVNPDNSGQQLHVRVFGEGFADFIYRTASELRDNYYIGKYYLVDVDAGDPYLIIFTAREPGSAFTFTTSVSGMTGLSVDGNTAGTDETMLDNYRIVAEACILGEQDWTSELMGTDAVAVDNDYRAGFDLAAYFSARLQTAFTFPKGSSNVVALANGCLHIFYRYAEFYGNEIKKVFSRYSFSKYIIRGGLSRADRKFYADENTDFFSYAENSKKFLTWCPSGKKTSLRSAERLFFLQMEDRKSLVLHVDYITTTGMGLGLDIESFSAEKGQLLELLCGVDDLALPDSTASYEVFLNDTLGNAITERFAFTVDHAEYLHKRYFLFRNSFDCYDALYCTGTFEKQTAYERTEISTLDDAEFTAHLAMQKIFNPEETQNYTANTGFISKQTLDYLREFLLSDEIWEVLGDILVPVVLKTKSAMQFKDRSHLYSLNFEYQVAWTDKHYSREIGEEGTNFLRKGNDYLTKGNDKLRKG